MTDAPVTTAADAAPMTEEEAQDAVHGKDRDRRFDAIASMAAPLMQALAARITNHDPNPQALVAGTVGCATCAGLIGDLRASLESLEGHLETSVDPGHETWVQGTVLALLGLRHGVSDLSAALRQQTYVAKAVAATVATQPVADPTPTPTPVADGVSTSFPAYPTFPDTTGTASPPSDYTPTPTSTSAIDPTPAQG